MNLLDSGNENENNKGCNMDLIWTLWTLEKKAKLIRLDPILISIMTPRDANAENALITFHKV
jgi:hypothetical protein